MKKFLIILVFGFSFLTAHALPALTVDERKMTQTVKAQVEEGQHQYDGALNDVHNAKQEASAAKGTAAQAAIDLKTAQDKFDAVNKDNARMKPVYDECTTYWGLGAIGYGFKQLIKHLFILAIVIVVLVAVVLALSAAFPAFGAIASIAIRGMGSVFHMAASGFESLVAMISKLFKRKKALDVNGSPGPPPLVTAVPSPAPPPPVLAPPAPIAPVPVVPPDGPTT